MGSAVKMRMDYSAVALRRLRRRRRMSPEQARVVAGWGHGRDEPGRCCTDRRHGPPDAAGLVHRFNEDGPYGLKDAWYGGPMPRLSPEQKAELAQIVEM